MSWIDRLLGRAAKVPAPPPAIRTPAPILSRRALVGGRLTLNSDTPFVGRFGTVLAAPASPETDWRRLNLDAKTLEGMTPADLMIMLADLSPDVSKALWDWIRFCNPGWECYAMRPGTEEQDQRAQELIDSFLASLRGPYLSQQTGGDVVFGMMFATMFLRGAVLIELVLDKAGRLPLNLALPDPVYMRLRKVDDPALGEGYELGQYQAGKWVAFNRPTIVYVPIDPLVMQPYGRPVAGSSLNTVIFLVAILNDLRRVIQQQGWPRLDLPINFEKLMSLMPSETDDPAAIKAWADKVVAEIETVYGSLEPEDAYIHSDAIAVNRPVGAVDTGSLGAISEIIRALERRVVRALKTQPMMMGINEATTETHAIQQWEIHAAGIRAIQHRIENALERLLVIALQAQGIQADVVFRFAELRASEAERDARTEAARIANEITKRDQGWITNDEASMAITGHHAVEDIVPTTVFTVLDATEDTEGDGEEPEETRASMRRIADILRRLGEPSDRVTIRPDGADEGPLLLPDVVTISDGEIDDALELWDELMPDYAGLLDAEVIEEETAAEGRKVAGVHQVGTTPQRLGSVTYYGSGLDGNHTRRRLPPDENPWQYDAKSRRYRDTRTGRFLNNNQMIRLRDEFTDANRVWFQEHAGRLNAGEIDLQQWERQARARLKSIHVDQYTLGRGARGSMTQADWGRVGHALRDQYAYLNGFAQEIATGTLSPATIAARSTLYVEASTASYERGRAAAHNLVLPAYPGDGSTQCRVNCKCTWRITENEDAWDCYWTLGNAEHCEDCVTRSQTWAPYTYPKR